MPKKIPIADSISIFFHKIEILYIFSLNLIAIISKITLIYSILLKNYYGLRKKINAIIIYFKENEPHSFL